MIFEFIFYSIIFWIVIKILNAVSRWWKKPVERKDHVHRNSNTNNYRSKFQDIEEAEFTEIESNPKKEKTQE
ncbi:MAG: hypothetical protein WB996_11515 [Ignavibacteriaceae bacterium]